MPARVHVRHKHLGRDVVLSRKLIDRLRPHPALIDCRKRADIVDGDGLECRIEEECDGENRQIKLERCDPRDATAGDVVVRQATWMPEQRGKRSQGLELGKIGGMRDSIVHDPDEREVMVNPPLPTGMAILTAQRCAAVRTHRLTRRDLGRWQRFHPAIAALRSIRPRARRADWHPDDRHAAHSALRPTAARSDQRRPFRAPHASSPLPA